VPASGCGLFSLSFLLAGLRAGAVGGGGSVVVEDVLLGDESETRLWSEWRRRFCECGSRVWYVPSQSFRARGASMISDAVVGSGECILRLLRASGSAPVVGGESSWMMSLSESWSRPLAADEVWMWMVCWFGKVVSISSSMSGSG
jgi:hypothetical protein